MLFRSRDAAIKGCQQPLPECNAGWQRLDGWWQQGLQQPVQNQEQQPGGAAGQDCASQRTAGYGGNFLAAGPGACERRIKA